MYGATFVFRDDKSDDVNGVSNESFHDQICEISQRVVGNWSWQLVSRMDVLIANNELMDAIGISDRKSVARRKKPRALWLAGRSNVYVYSSNC